MAVKLTIGIIVGKTSVAEMPNRDQRGSDGNHSQQGILHLYSSAVTEPVILADVVRSDFVEGHHRGSVVVTNPDGSVDWSAGIVDQPMFPRSSNKPMQALGMLRNGLPLDGKLLALAGASHSGEQFHLDGVREILAGVGLDETALRTPASYPYDDQSRDEWVRPGHAQEQITMNCSGKHAAMIATCVHNGWPIHDPASEKSPDGVWGLTTTARRTTRCSRRFAGRSKTPPARRSRMSRSTAAEHRSCAQPLRPRPLLRPLRVGRRRHP